ncbi:MULTISPECIES: hypothetical protein [unclassified Streptomyces]|uniref:hypothetical protein n=1 Tax=unclassified Streptomyces TaxID=2593676 RepID=UPI00093DF3AF|nr:hypothetical protein [Streptomyces sp. TSRI0281]OKI38403.1 hypothetical protein A6A29_10595 [Streptomyces sp. TSRI0281]
MDGTAIYQARWVQGGRSGSSESEPFGDKNSAEQFKKLVDAHGQQWPHGWTKGRGFVEEPAVPGDMPFEQWAERCISKLTGIEDRTREDCRRDLRIHLSLLRHTTMARVSGQAGPACPAGYSLQPPPGDPDAWVCRRDGAPPAPSTSPSSLTLDPSRRTYP